MKDSAIGKDSVSADDRKTAYDKAALRARHATNKGLDVKVGNVYEDTRGITIFYCHDLDAEAFCEPDQNICGYDGLEQGGIKRFRQRCEICFRIKGNSTPSHTS